jgi:DNA-binding LytR/AlgR family response regulator
MIRCIVIDDEELVRELLEDNIRQVPFLQLVASCKNPMAAYTILQTGQVDLMFLDIQMPGLNGLQFLQSLQKPPLVILVTAYEQYALKGFDLQVVDYLLKPFSFERWIKACNRASDLFHLQQTQQTGGVPGGKIPDFLFVNVEYGLVKVTVSDIEYIEGLKDYIRIHLSSEPNKPILTRMSLRDMEEKLPDDAFVRTHKSFLVSVGKITAVKRDLVYLGKTEIPVGDFYKQTVTRVINQRR